MYALEKYPFNYNKYALVLMAYKNYCRVEGDFYEYEHLVYLIPHCERRMSKRGLCKITGKDYEVVKRAEEWFNKIAK